jgi:hypothetical protein
MSREPAPQKESATDSEKDPAKDPAKDQDRPPILRTWRQAYVLVLVTLLGVVLLFSALTWVYG